jgi:hypothetical protein
MNIIITESQYKLIVEDTTPGNLGILDKNVHKPRIVYFNTPNGLSGKGYEGTPEDHKMIKKMINVYRALSKGRGSIQLYTSDAYPPLDVSYELPPLNTVAILITYPTRKMKNEVDYMFDVVGKVKYTFHNFETQRETDMDRFMMHRSHDVSFVYKKRFANFGVKISS